MIAPRAESFMLSDSPTGYWSISPWTLVLAAAAIAGFLGVEEKSLAKKDVLGEIVQLKLLLLYMLFG